jgi:outer membrane protein assembly factor BamB
MARRHVAAVLAYPLLAAGLFAFPADKPKPAAKPAGAEPSADVLAEVKGWNSDRFVAPPASFRQGNVTPRVLVEKAAAAGRTGFVVKLPSGAPVPTPSVYQGKVYVSGGFHSKEFYCLDAATGKPVWGVNLDDDGPTSAACQDGVIVFNTESCTIFALDARTGKQLWSLWLGDPLTSTPTVANGKVFTAYPAHGGGGAQNAAPGGAKPARADRPAPPCSHVLAAFDLKTGKILWQRWIDSDVMSAPVAVGNELYVASFSGVVYKFDQADGNIRSAVRSRATSAPVVVGDKVYFTRRADNGKGPAQEGISGRERHTLQEQVAGGVKDAPYLDKNVQLGADWGGQAKALDAGNGFASPPPAANPGAGFANVGQGNVSSLQAFQGSRILNRGGDNVNSMGDEVVCTDAATGKRKWSLKLEGDLKKEGGFLAAPPAEAGGQLFVATLKGEVLRVDPNNGKVTARYKAGGPLRSQPAVEGGRIYVGTQDGRLVCIDTGDAHLSGWPCWGANPAHTGLQDGKAGR